MTFSVFLWVFLAGWVIRGFVDRRIESAAHVESLERLRQLTEDLESGRLGGYRITTLKREADGSTTRKVFDPQLGELDTEDWGKDWTPENDPDFD
ncbi:hypothetical protein SH661x_001933 [Planctomicrobium sp. SH661]|uniref:hypothetical protein n=1 Tax=Planctomicrobium sp. SH661 TaxID=3448124 RepID=UPI003F5C9D00